jgi:signal transduction histidine kinase
MSSSAKANAALAAALVLLLLSATAGYMAFSRLHASEGWVKHTRDVQVALAEFSMTTTRASRLRAEYVDSGDAALLEQQTNVVLQMRSAVGAIQRMTADNPREQFNCSEIARLTEERVEEMNSSIALKRTGKSTLEAQAPIARRIVTTGAQTDQVLQGMYDEEERLLNERQERVRTFSAVINVILIASLVLALVLFVVHHRLLTDQVRERARAEAAQRALSAKLLTLQDEERRRFARELHDSVGQHLSAMKMGISILQAKLPGDAMLQDCIKLLDDSIAETRTISHLLHPPLLDEAGLNSASRWFVEGFGRRSGIEIDLDIRDEVGRLPDATELVLFRVLQESLTNVHRHSGAKRADVSLRKTGHEVILRVKDYGHGMPAGVVQSLREDGFGGGVGLAGMAERIREIGGRLEINSSAAGTEIAVRVPARKRAEPQQQIKPPAAEEVRG